MEDYMLARRGDPETSHTAAQMALPFIGTHAERIELALKRHGPQTVDELTMTTGLNTWQIARRLPELERDGKAYPIAGVARLSMAGRPERVWSASP